MKCGFMDRLLANWYARVGGKCGHWENLPERHQHGERDERAKGEQFPQDAPTIFPHSVKFRSTGLDSVTLVTLTRACGVSINQQLPFIVP